MKIVCLVLLLSCAARAEVSLMDALRRGEHESPYLKGAQQRETALRENIRAQRSRYFPELSLSAIASTGAPGAFALMDVDGNLPTGDRLGEGGALVLKQDLWDFGRTDSAVKNAEAQRDLQRSRQKTDKIDVDRQILRTYLNCAYLKSEVADSKFVVDQAQVLARETGKFVASGQRSIVERYLFDAQAKEAETRAAEYSARIVVTQQRLGVLLGTPDQKIECGDLVGAAADVARIEKLSGTNPLIEIQEKRVAVALSRLNSARAETRPFIYGVATGGYFDNDQLKDKLNYSAGVGISLPLFNGFKVDADEKREAADLEAERTGIELTRQQLGEADSRYDEQVRALSVRLDFLDRERKMARTVFDLSRKRYESMQGTMIDLREAISNIDRILQSGNEARRDLFIARGERSFFNGAVISE